jgi:hypothetical protein
MIHRRQNCLRVALLVRVFIAPDHHREEKCEEQSLCHLKSQAISARTMHEGFDFGGDGFEYRDVTV